MNTIAVGEVLMPTEDQPPTPKPLAYATAPVVPPACRPPYVAMSIVIGLLSVALLVLIVTTPGREDPNYVPFRITVRCTVFAWVLGVGGLVASFRNEKRRQRAWQRARLSPEEWQGPRI